LFDTFVWRDTHHVTSLLDHALLKLIIYSNNNVSLSNISEKVEAQN